MFLYYSIPLIIMQIVNFVFFVRTIVYCLRVKNEINKMNDNRISVKGRRKSYNVDKEQWVDNPMGDKLLNNVFQIDVNIEIERDHGNAFLV